MKCIAFGLCLTLISATASAQQSLDFGALINADRQAQESRRMQQENAMRQNYIDNIMPFQTEMQRNQLRNGQPIQHRQYITPCISDCSGHEAGYMWAAQYGLIDPNTCTGKSQSFIDGCLTYIVERVR